MFRYPTADDQQAFLASLRFTPLARLPVAEMRAHHARWSWERQVHALDRQPLEALLVAMGVSKGKSGSVRFWRGVELRQAAGDKA